MDDQDHPVEGAGVDATWTYPKVDSLKVSGATASDGYVTFTIDKARRGTYHLYINDVTADGYVYDLINTNTTGVILKISKQIPESILNKNSAQPAFARVICGSDAQLNSKYIPQIT